MDESGIKIHEIHERLHELESTQRKSRRRKLVLILMSLITITFALVFLGLSSVYNILTPEKSIYNLETLSVEDVNNYFQQNQGDMYIEVPGIDQIFSISSVGDYWTIMDEYTYLTLSAEISYLEELSGWDLSKRNNELVDTNSKIIQDDFLKTSAGEIAILGDKISGSPLYFVLIDYHPLISYHIDFGDGITRSLQNRSCGYRYTQPGTYAVTLTGTHKDQPVAFKTEILQIKE